MSSCNRVTTIPTPIYNMPQVPFLSLPLSKDSQNRLMAIETIALPGTPLHILSQLSSHLLSIETEAYPDLSPLYIDARFLEEKTKEPFVKFKELPPLASIISKLRSLQGIRYFWGGTWEEGIAQMWTYYPHLSQADTYDREDSLCQGVDCSGLLYRVTNGYTPRNTAQLAHFGQEIPFTSLLPHKVQSLLQPLDIIVWKGHVIIVLSQDELIESRLGTGVVISGFKKRFEEISIQLTAENRPFYLRRWLPSISLST